MAHHRAVYLALLTSGLLLACGSRYGGEPHEDRVPASPAPVSDPTPSEDPDTGTPETADASPPDAGETSPCGSWAESAPPAAEGFTLGELEILEAYVTSNGTYLLGLQSEKASAGPPRHRLLLERRCVTTDCSCPGVMLVSTLGWNPTVTMSIADDKAALSIKDPNFNGGGQSYALCVDLTGQADPTKLPFGSPVSDCP